MKMRLVIAAAALTVSPVVLGQLVGRTSVEAPGRSLRGATAGGVAGLEGPAGPDVIVGDLTGSAANGSLGGPLNWGALGGIRVYSIGTTGCNIGDEPLDWYDFGTETPTKHPVIAQNLYRLHEGRFEQIGMSWVKHAFCALQQTLCGTCIPFGGGCEDELGVGCSDPYDATTNGLQFRLGPRSEINAATGEILVWPFTPASSGSGLNGRVQVLETDLDPAVNPGARYFAEGHYIAEDDAEARNDNNNASYREVEVTGPTFSLPYAGPIQRMKPALQAWQDIDPEVSIVTVDVPDDGRFLLAWRITDNGDGTWHYEYALYNMNSDRSGQRFAVPVSACVALSGIGFHGIPHHSGEPYDTAVWSSASSGGTLSWFTDSWLVNPDANALRWGTLFNFRFDADVPPVAGAVEIGLFKPGAPEVMMVNAQVPAVAAPPAADCAAAGDGTVDVRDLLALLGQWGGPGSCDIEPAGGDGVVGPDDLALLLAEWGEPSCP